MSINTPWVITSSELERHMANKDVIIVDVSKRDIFMYQHIPGARFIDYNSIVKHAPPVVGMLPDSDQLSKALSELGVTMDDYLVVYDEEGGGKASRLIWTLEIAGHKKMSLLDGGITNWLLEGKPASQSIPEYQTSNYVASLENMQGVANTDYILSQLNNPHIKILDTRSANEFNGTDVRGSRAGHIPGAVNIDWLQFKDAKTQKLINQSALTSLLENNDITPYKEIIVHCHSHHRSALCYVALKHLGYKEVKGYPASWSEWAARSDTPVEI